MKRVFFGCAHSNDGFTLMELLIALVLTATVLGIMTAFFMNFSRASTIQKASNRHCPTCQGINSQRWLAAQAEVLLPIPYFHLVFTLPHSLNPLIQQNQTALYALLFASGSETLLSFGRHNLRAQLGLTAVLHTWSQTLLDHYHIHCIVTGGGPALEGRGWIASHPNYLFNVRALSTVFRAKFCQGLQALYAKGKLQFHGELRPLAQPATFQALVRTATRQNCVVYSKRPFAGPQQVLAYLSRYTHRVGISNRRLLALDPKEQTITFDYKDYADGARHVWFVEKSGIILVIQSGKPTDWEGFGISTSNWTIGHNGGLIDGDPASICSRLCASCAVSVSLCP